MGAWTESSRRNADGSDFRRLQCNHGYYPLQQRSLTRQSHYVSVISINIAPKTKVRLRSDITALPSCSQPGPGNRYNDAILDLGLATECSVHFPVAFVHVSRYVCRPVCLTLRLAVRPPAYTRLPACPPACQFLLFIDRFVIFIIRKLMYI